MTNIWLAKFKQLDIFVRVRRFCRGAWASHPLILFCIHDTYINIIIFIWICLWVYFWRYAMLHKNSSIIVKFANYTLGKTHNPDWLPTLWTQKYWNKKVKVKKMNVFLWKVHKTRLGVIRSSPKNGNVLNIFMTPNINDKCVKKKCDIEPWGDNNEANSTI